jgi:hypothetical protein
MRGTARGERVDAVGRGIDEGHRRDAGPQRARQHPADQGDGLTGRDQGRRRRRRVPTPGSVFLPVRADGRRRIANKAYHRKIEKTAGAVH